MLKKFKVLHINTNDRGGAAIACQRIHLGLLKIGVDSELLYKLKTTDLINTSQFNARQTLEKRIFDKLVKSVLKSGVIKKEWINHEYKFKRDRPKGLEYFSYPYSDCDITKTKEYLDADIIHLHWVAGFLDWESFFRNNTKPVVWTLHDQNPYLGGQHYNERFYGMNNQGFPIKRNLTESEIKEDNAILDIKRKALKDVNNIYVVGNSKWNKIESEKSELFGKFPHLHISYGYPTDMFRPLNKKFCRNLLGLPLDKKIVLFGADSVVNQRKGFIYLQKAIEKIEISFDDILIRVMFCAFGSGRDEDSRIRFLGEIKDERILGCIYNAADVFIIPSLEEALGMVAVESMLCGTPVIGFPTGGISETIIKRENGILCDRISVDALYKAILKFLLGEVQFNSESISQAARDKYSSEKQAKAYIKLYEEILGSQS